MKKISAYEIALSAVSCALAAIALTVGTLSHALLFTGYLLACFALMIPLSKNCWWGNVLAYIGSSLLALLFTGFDIWDMLPFIVFFGLHPLLNALQLKFKVNRWLATGIKASWFDGAMYLVWRFVFEMNASFDFVNRFIIPVILIGGTLFFFVYDIMFSKCQIAVNSLVQRIIKK